MASGMARRSSPDRFRLKSPPRSRPRRRCRSNSQRKAFRPGRVLRTISAEGAVPNADGAKIDPRKAIEYALNPEHPVGGNKARVFEAALGFNQANAAELIRQLQEGVAETAAQPGKVDQFGARYTVDISVVGPKGSGIVRTGWIVTPGSDVPILTTMFVK